MGIPQYFNSILKRYDSSHIVSMKLKHKIDRYFLDLNGIIHPCSHNVLKDNSERPLPEIEDKICDETIKYIVQTVNEIKPSKLLFIGIDGVAPRAKMAQQRKRRYKSVHDKIEDPTLKDKTPSKWDSNAITPGTDFMEKLSIRLKNSKELLEIKELLNIEIIVSDAKVPREGEHKITHYIADNKILDENYDCIHGLDADLIMLSSMLYPTNILLYRHDSQKNTKKYFNINHFVEMIQHHFETYCSDKMKTNDIIREYIFLCFFVGNDFLPHNYGIEIRDDGIDYLIEEYMKIYNKTKKNLTFSSGKINTSFLHELLTNISQTEDTMVMSRSERTVYKNAIRHGHSKEEQFTYYPDYHRQIEKKIGFGGEGWRSRYYEEIHKMCGIKDLKIEDMVQNMCLKYIQGLQWNLNYYLQKPISLSWYYPYLHAPTIKDLSQFTENIDMNKIKPKGGKKYTCFEQLALVLPPQSSQLLPLSWKTIASHPRFFPEHYKLDPIGSIFRWQCSPILYHFNEEDLFRKLKHKKLTVKELEFSKVGKSYSI